MLSVVEQPKLSDYPITASGERIEIIEADTQYKFVSQDNKSGRWQAVLAIKSRFKGRDGKEATAISIRMYRWEFREVTKWLADEKKRIGTGEYKWMLEQTYTINKKDIWEKNKSSIDKMVTKYL